MKSQIKRVNELILIDDRSRVEVQRLASLMKLFARLPQPPDPLGLLPKWSDYFRRFISALQEEDPEQLEESSLAMYAYLHGNEAPYSVDERKKMDSVGGYWNHAGGITPILKAPDYLEPVSVSADLGAGNGLQCLLMQILCPHSKSIQVEISSAAVEFGKQLQDWLGIERDRIEWRVGDVMEVDFSGMDFIYMYRPVRPVGLGEEFYKRMARQLVEQGRSIVVFSIADCLREFLPNGSFEVLFSNGHLTSLKICRDSTHRTQNNAGTEV